MNRGLFARSREALGTPGMMIGVFSLVSLAFGLSALARGYNQLREMSRKAIGQVIGDWVRSTPVDYLGLTLPDHLAHWQRADARTRPATTEDLRDRLNRLGRMLNRRGGPDPLVAIAAMELKTDEGEVLARWPILGKKAFPTDSGDERSPDEFEDVVPMVPRDPEGGSAIALSVRYRISPIVERATSAVEKSYRRLLLALAGLSLYSLLSLGYMVLHARALRDRAARESAREATLDLADRTCHELGNVVFVLANERRNLDGHLELIERYVNEEPEARRLATRRAGIDEASAARFEKELRRELAERGIDPQVELPAGAAIARVVCKEIEVCSRYIALTVRELDGYLKRSALPVTLESLVVADCFDDALALLGPRLESAGARVERPIAEDGRIAAIADRRLLVHALVNLLKNAVEAATAAGIAPTIRLDVAREGPLVRVSVRDDGPGLATDAPARIFEVGYSTKGPGRGRGLSIVRESIRAQGGRIRLNNFPGSGAEFVIELKAAECPALVDD